MYEWNHRNGPSWPFHWVSAILDSVVDLKRVLVLNLFLVIRHLFFLKWIVLQSVIFTLSEVLVIHVRGLIIIHNNYCGNNKGQSTQHSWQQSKEEINFLRVAGIQGTNYHKRKIVSNGSICSTDYFSSQLKLARSDWFGILRHLQWLFSWSQGFQFVEKNRLSTGIVENVLQSYEKWFWLYMEISPTKFLAAVQCRNIVAGIFKLRELQLTQ